MCDKITECPNLSVDMANSEVEMRKLSDSVTGSSKKADEIKGHTVDTVKSIEDLIKKSSQGKDSIKSIKSYFSEFSSEIHNINNNLAFLSQKIVEQTDHTQYVAAFNQNLEAFFADFKRDVSVIVGETENQSVLEDEDIEYSQKMHFAMEKLTDFTKEFEKIIESKLIEYCNDIAEKICKDNFTIEKLCKYVGKTNISSFYITDGDGVIVMTNDSETMGFRFEDDPSSQTFQFRKILSNRDLVVVQDFVNNSKLNNLLNENF